MEWPENRSQLEYLSLDPRGTFEDSPKTPYVYSPSFLFFLLFHLLLRHSRAIFIWVLSSLHRIIPKCNSIKRDFFLISGYGFISSFLVMCHTYLHTWRWRRRQRFYEPIRCSILGKYPVPFFPLFLLFLFSDPRLLYKYC